MAAKTARFGCHFIKTNAYIPKVRVLLSRVYEAFVVKRSLVGAMLGCPYRTAPLARLHVPPHPGLGGSDIAWKTAQLDAREIGHSSSGNAMVSSESNVMLAWWRLPGCFKSTASTRFAPPLSLLHLWFDCIDYFHIL
jgi:hypothetical protein